MFGGYAQGFRVRHLRDRTFKFSVASKSVGFEIYNNGRIVEQDFEVLFSLWNYGGPNWFREELAFYKELDSEWTLVGRHGKVVPNNSGDRRSYSAVVRNGRSVFERLSGVIQTNDNQGESLHSPSLNSEINGSLNQPQMAQRAAPRTYVMYFACGGQGHFARNNMVPKLPRLWPFF